MFTCSPETMVNIEEWLIILEDLTSVVALTMTPCHLFHEKFLFTAIERSLLDPLIGEAWLISKR